MKALLSREQAVFTVKDVDADDCAYDELIARGYMVVPVTFIGDRSISGYDPEAIKNALAAFRRQSPDA